MRRRRQLRPPKRAKLLLMRRWIARTACIVTAFGRIERSFRERISHRNREAGKMSLPPRRSSSGVAVLFRHGARPYRLREKLLRLSQTDLADRISETALRRRGVRAALR